MLAVGDKAPDFQLIDSDGDEISLAQFAGQKNVVLYFYPADDTPGCTIEAQGFSSRQSDYEALETVVLGVSTDSQISHQKFCRKYGLRVTLLVDADHRVTEEYGAWQEKNLFGHQHMGTIRSTYLIDRSGTIRQIWPKVKPEGHELAVLEAIREL